MPPTRPLEERFWEKVDKQGPTMPGMKTRCWVWTGGCDGCGYGTIGLGPSKGVGKASRVAWKLERGEIPDGLCVLHHCDNPPCVRDEHLYLGTQKQNAADREQRGRGNQPCGARHGSKTKPESVKRGDDHWTRRYPGSAAGEKNPKAKLTKRIVTAIRKAHRAGGVLYEDLAMKYGVDKTTVGRIVRRETWAT